jgi:hypothetical protein
MLDAKAMRVGRHEAIHAALLHALGWPIRGVSRKALDANTDGITLLDPQTHGDVMQRGEELGVVLIGPVLRDGDGCDADLTRLTELVQSGVKLSRVWDRAEQLLARPEVMRVRFAIEAALQSRPELSAEQVAEIIAGAEA